MYFGSKSEKWPTFHFGFRHYRCYGRSCCWWFIRRRRCFAFGFSRHGCPIGFVIRHVRVCARKVIDEKSAEEKVPDIFMLLDCKHKESIWCTVISLPSPISVCEYLCMHPIRYTARSMTGGREPTNRNIVQVSDCQTSVMHSIEMVVVKILSGK